MTATDELRRLLDERGVEHTVIPEDMYGSREYIKIGSTEIRTNGLGQVAVFYLTPEQAVEATLGRGTCRFIDEDNYNEAEGCDAYSWFRCSACGWTFDECDRWLTTMSYCPNCGRKVRA